MIEIIPAIDIIEGKCVRLTKGSYETKKSYYDDPLEVAHKFEAAGLTRVHLVDLDGAKEGRVINYKIIENIAVRTGLRIDFGGGIRTGKDLEIAFECGAKQVTAGSIAVKEKQMVFDWFSKYGTEAIILGADVKYDKIAIHGWQEESGLFVNDFLNEYKTNGAKYVVCTDIEKDGTLEGPGFELYKRILCEIEGISLIASGGISSINDVEELQKQGLYGVIIGKAIYEGKISLSDLKVFLC